MPDLSIPIIAKRCAIGLMAGVLATGWLLAWPAQSIGNTNASLDTTDDLVPRDDDPTSDGWDTEVFNLVAGSQLKQLGKLLEHPSQIDAEHVASLVTVDVTCTPLRPGKVVQTFRDGAIRTVRAAKPGGGHVVELHRGADGFARALRDLAEPFAGAKDFRVKSKIVHVDVRVGAVTTRQLLAISGRRADGSVEAHATWDCKWLAGKGDDPPRLRSIVMSNFVQVELRAAGRTLFSDCTEAVLGANDVLRSQLVRGTTYWQNRHERVLGTEMGGYFGLAIGDVNGDDLDDVYICQAGGLPNRLFIQNADGTASDRSQWANVNWLDDTKSALLVDLDNDGDRDLVIGTLTALLIMVNDGQGRFVERVSFSYMDMAFSLAAADYDLDGDLDIYVCRYDLDHLESGNVPSPVPFYDANNGADNRLLRNDGYWTFTDVTKESGLDQDNRRFSLAAVWEDYDNDGDPDLYVANDFGRNCLYRNDDGRFVNIADRVGVEDHATGMSACWGDYNHDGRMDLYVGNMWSSAGKRITFQSQFRPDMDQSKKSLVQRLARGNSLFTNVGPDTFADVSLDAAVNMGRWAWSSLFVDLNSDGWEDLVVANGFITLEDSGDL